MNLVMCAFAAIGGCRVPGLRHHQRVEHTFPLGLDLVLIDGSNLGEDLRLVLLETEVLDARGIGYVVASQQGSRHANALVK